MASLPYSTNNDGERIIPASTRADGTVRPERKIREGYIPQEEQPIYKSRAALERRGVPICPGANFVEEKEKTMSKSAKKNMKRKQKKKESTDTVQTSTPAEITEKIGELTVNESSAGSGLTAREKELRALNKKVKQCEVLERRRDAGESLTEQEVAKLSKVDDWREQIAKLSV